MSFAPHLARICVSAVALAVVAAPPARAESPLASLAGSWSGGGQIKLEGGKTESLKCKGYYTNKSDGLSLAIRCASASNSIEMRALLIDNGGKVSGTWEERTFNAAGEVTGQATASKLSVSIVGPVTGSMNVTFGPSSQTVTISTDGSALKGVTISLSRTS